MYTNYWERKKRGYKILAFCMLLVAFIVAVSNYVSFQRIGADNLLPAIAIAAVVTGGLCALLIIVPIVQYIRENTGGIRASSGPKERPEYLKSQDLIAEETCPVCNGLVTDRICTKCGARWCLNCGTWNTGSGERCEKCTFMLPRAQQ